MTWWLPQPPLSLLFLFKDPGESQTVCAQWTLVFLGGQLNLFFSDNVNSTCPLLIYLKKSQQNYLLLLLAEDSVQVTHR